MGGVAINSDEEGCIEEIWVQRKGQKISSDHLEFKMSITHLNGDFDKLKVGQRLYKGGKCKQI